MSFWSSLGTAILGGLASSYEGKQDARLTREQIEAQGRESRRNTEFQLGLADWYNQRDRAEKRKAFENYRSFSNLGDLAPFYREKPSATPLPTKPTAG